MGEDINRNELIGNGTLYINGEEIGSIECINFDIVPSIISVAAIPISSIDNLYAAYHEYSNGVMKFVGLLHEEELDSFYKGYSK